MSEARIESVSMDQIMAETVKAAEDVLKRHGFDRIAVVVNVAWREHNPWASGDVTCAMGSRIPRNYRPMMAESLAESASEARDER